ncbi:MAG TPA: alpha/beta fold hydrolase, partial [Planctomycetaceae bacterium]|nr:alpha/beta fold hydrolase [Planctomycetaceae bacterium]
MPWILLIAALSPADDSAPPAAASGSSIASDKDIEALLAPIREKHQVPGLVAGIVNGDALAVAGAVGIRKAGSPELFTVNDKVHIGSDTKAMTATRIAMLVEEGKLSWKSTVGEVFAHLKSELHADFLGVTLEQLLSHRAGIKDFFPFGDLGSGTIAEQREMLLKKALAKAPSHPPGTKFVYSNIGYIIAGHMAEHATGMSWEELMTVGLFEPLQMRSAGFGFPGAKGTVDQPWGHVSMSGKAFPLQLDNPPVLGPAGTVHCSLRDWAQFAAAHLQGARGKSGLISSESFQALQTPAAGTEYALGWGMVQRPWANGRVLTHSGSNTMWYATVAIAPERNLAFLVAANQGGTPGQQACDAALAALISHELKLPPAELSAERESVIPLKTPGGVRFGVKGAKPSAPAPTLFVFATDFNTTLQSDDYNKVGRLLAKEGVLCVALDLPCHGQNVREGEPQGLQGWAARLRNDDGFVAAFAKDVSSVLDYLIAEGFSDPKRIAACGTSRGGFMALQIAAAEPRMARVAAFAPVTDLRALSEFKELEAHPKT